MCMVKIQKFCNKNNDDNLNKKGNTVLCTLHLMSDAFGTYNLKKNSGHSLELLLQYWTTKENTSEFNMFTEFSYSYVKCVK